MKEQTPAPSCKIIPLRIEEEKARPSSKIIPLQPLWSQFAIKKN